ncbi:DUF4429 domain-containing protein [Enterococcus cecorum]|uniref:DUF4429 domain-containing protein n=1 Tax=Enterococcus cecorum TaxID=44008 RepID=UPI00148D5506|nr:DUF4429 domain-containing protein [Enterococcus cecorum]
MKKKILTKQPLTVGPGTEIFIKKPMKTTINITDNAILINREGMNSFLIQGAKGQKTIPLKNITSVQFKLPGGMTNGYIQFSMLGSLESKGGIQAAVRDENSIVFTKKDNEIMTALKDYVENIVLNTSDSSSPQLSAADEIAKFKKLLDDGILTQEEFDKKKAELLGL